MAAQEPPGRPVCLELTVFQQEQYDQKLFADYLKGWITEFLRQSGLGDNDASRAVSIWYEQYNINNIIVIVVLLTFKRDQEEKKDAYLAHVMNSSSFWVYVPKVREELDVRGDYPRKPSISLSGFEVIDYYVVQRYRKDHSVFRQAKLEPWKSRQWLPMLNDSNALIFLAIAPVVVLLSWLCYKK